MFSICKQTVPASGIEFAIKCNFFNNLEKNLVVAGANVLKVFRIIPDVELNTKEKFTGTCVLSELNVKYVNCTPSQL
jgi:cleavage and polyadenylation specificity factor subunit 1